MDQLDFSEFFKTKLEANDFSTRLSVVAEKIYATDFDLEKALLEQFGIRHKEKLVIFLRDNKIATESNTALKQFFDMMQGKIAAMPVLSLTLAFEPKEQTLQVLSQWFVLNTKMQVLFDISVDPQLIAGATFNYNGKHFDFSIKPVFEQIFQDTALTKMPPSKEKTETHLPETHQDIESISLGR